VQHLFKKQDRVIIHLMNNAFQYNYDYYQECEEDRFYNFVVMDPLQISELDGTKCENFQHIYFPLALDTSERPEVYSVPERVTPIHIGIVMRLSINRPIEFFFYAFKDLLQHVDARLHIYGQGDPGMFFRVLDRLHIHDKVIFEGQQKDLQRVVENENLSMIWLTCNGPILGYASVEIANYGIPMVFWNLHNSSTEDVLNATDGAVYAFSHISRFVEYTLSLLRSTESLRSAGESMRSFVITRYDVRHYINELESYYQEVAVRFQ
jgi:glycosyltransferase involved in cell wall biosynthesis